MVDPHISNRLKLGDGIAAAPEVFRHAEFTLVRLARDIDAEGRLLAAGSEGMIVDADADGIRYTVEFDSPFAAVVVLTAADFGA